MTGVLAHVLMALLCQCAVGLWRRDWASGAVLGVALFVGREQAQAEYRWMAAHRVNRDGWSELVGSFSPSVWNTHSLLGFLAPALACTLLYGLVRGWRAWRGGPSSAGP